VGVPDPDSKSEIDYPNIRLSMFLHSPQTNVGLYFKISSFRLILRLLEIDLPDDATWLGKVAPLKKLRMNQWHFFVPTI
jgi:hypothetical protein